LTSAVSMPKFTISMNRSVKDQIIEQVERLDDSRRRQVLDFTRRLGAFATVPGRDLMRFAGSIAPPDLLAITRAIQEGCEKVESDAS